MRATGRLVGRALVALTESLQALMVLALLIVVVMTLVVPAAVRDPERTGLIALIVLGSVLGIVVVVAAVVSLVRLIHRAVVGPLVLVEAASRGGVVALGGRRVTRVLRRVEPRFPRVVLRPYAVVVPCRDGLLVSLGTSGVEIPWSRIRSVSQQPDPVGLRRRPALVVGTSRFSVRTRPLVLVLVEEPGVGGLRPAPQHTRDLLLRRIAERATPVPGPAAPSWGDRSRPPQRASR